MPEDAEWLRDSAQRGYDELVEDVELGFCCNSPHIHAILRASEQALSLPGKAPMEVTGEWAESVSKVLQCAVLHDEKNAVYQPGMRQFTAAMLLMFQYDESKAFWSLVCACTSKMEGYWATESPGVEEDIWVVSDLLQDITPDLHAHVTALGSSCGELVREWFNTGFAAALDTKALRALWETTFNKGEGRRALVAAAVAVLKWAEEELLQAETIPGRTLT